MTPLDVWTAIQRAYPNAIKDEHYTIVDDEAGAYVANWTYPAPIPEGVPTMLDTPFARWYGACVALCRLAATEIIDKTAGPQRIYAASGLAAVIDAAAPLSELAPGVTREMGQEMAALWDWFLAASLSALEDPRAHGKSPIQIITDLGQA